MGRVAAIVRTSYKWVSIKGALLTLDTNSGRVARSCGRASWPNVVLSNEVFVAKRLGTRSD